MLNEDQIKKLFFDPISERWSRFNTWLMEDDELSEEAFKIHFRLKAQKVKPDTQEYWDLIDIELYRKKKDRLLRYFSHNN